MAAGCKRPQDGAAPAKAPMTSSSRYSDALLWAEPYRRLVPDGLAAAVWAAGYGHRQENPA